MKLGNNLKESEVGPFELMGARTNRSQFSSTESSVIQLGAPQHRARLAKTQSDLF